MPTDSGDATRLEMVHVLFMDVVGYTRLPLDRQDECIEELQALVRTTATFRRADAEGTLLSHPSGDGMALAFFTDPSAPVRCALEIATEIRGRGAIELRMGVHSGLILRGEDINRTPNVRGPAINMANRVMDCGDAGHILVSRSTGDMLRELSQWSDVLIDLGDVEVKHGQSVGVYNLVDGSLGNPTTPSRVRTGAPIPAAAEPARPGMRVSDSAHVVAIGSADVRPPSDLLDRLEDVAHGDPSYRDAESHGAALTARFGDDLLLVFFHGLVAAARCGLDIHAAARAAGLGSLRVGVDTGSIDEVGGGSTSSAPCGRLMDAAQAVMTAGVAGQVTLSEAAAEAIRQDESWNPALDAIATPRATDGQHLYRLWDASMTPTSQSVVVRNAPTGTKVALLYRRNAHPDEELLALLEERLTDVGHSVFIDRHLTVGIQWAREIEQQIRTSDVVVTLLSAASVRSEMLEYEIRVAHEAAGSADGGPRILPVRVNYDGALPRPMASILDPLQQFFWTGEPDNARMLDEIADAITGDPPAGDLADVATPVGGAVPVDSKLYVVRPTDDLFHRAVARQDSIVLVKGARQMGKTSLLARGLQQARDSGTHALFTDLQAFSAAQVASPEEFFLALGYSLAEQMDLDVFPEERWTDRLGPGVNFERYLRRVVLVEAEHVLWAIDEVDRMFVTEYASEVFGLFRSWHNKRALDPSG